MNRAEYAIEVRRTMPHRNDDLQLAIYVLGLIGEAGELDSALELYKLKPSESTRVQISKELGDCYWYAFALAASCGLSLDRYLTPNKSPIAYAALVAERVKKYLGHGERLDYEVLTSLLGRFLSAVHMSWSDDESTIMRLNSEKLRKRYPEGFSVTSSLERKE